jgi:ribonuclease HI
MPFRSARPQSDLFGSSSSPQAPADVITAYTDGGARGNPGPSGYGVVINDSNGHKIAGFSKYLGKQTNNYAEYSGLLAALEYAVQHGYKALKVISDSELMVKQIKGQYKVSNLQLKELHTRAKELISKLEWFQIQHVLRGHNAEADRLANQAMDQGSGGFSRSSSSPSTAVPPRPAELKGVVKNGAIELIDGELPEGTRVKVRPLD